MKSKFIDGVYKIVKQIPKGKVMSYGQVALYLGVPRGARQVGWVLNKSKDEDNLPWWRVVNNQGRISIKGFKYSPIDQKNLLEAEGVIISDDLTFNIEEYRFIADDKFINNLQLDPFVANRILSKITVKRHNI